MVNDVAEELYFKPDADRLMVSPADATPTEAGDAQPEDLDVAITVDRFMAATTLEVRRVPHRWAGLRSFAADAAPVIGEDALVPGFFWCAGQGGFGVMTSPRAVSPWPPARCSASRFRPRLAASGRCCSAALRPLRRSGNEAPRLTRL